ncbi:MAG: SLC13 family permease [Candidatus Edwardsbacteria bacterium]
MRLISILSVIIVPLVLTLLAHLGLGLSFRQDLSFFVFLSFITGTLIYWERRLAFAFIGVFFLLIFQVLDIPNLLHFANLDVILFLIGMMIVIGFLEERKFFEILVERILEQVQGSAWRLISMMLILAALSAALVDEVTSILFMSAVMFHITERFELDPAPFLIMLVFATNIGSSMTVVGNPIGVLIALRAGFTFIDFIRWVTPISLVGLAFCILLCFWFFARPIKSLNHKMGKSIKGKIEENHISRRNFRISLYLFLGVIGGLILHHQLEKWLYLEKNTLLVGIALIGGAIALFLEGEKARNLVEKKVEWWTLAFFLLLFASVGTLHYVGITSLLAQKVVDLTGGNQNLLLIILTWSVGILSAFLDNVLAVATFIPIIQDLAKTGISIHYLWWGILLGGTFLGNLTLIGSTANIVVLGLLEKRGHKVTFWEWFKPGFVVAVSTLVLATFLLIIESWLWPR